MSAPPSAGLKHGEFTPWVKKNFRQLMRRNASLGGEARIAQLTAEERRALPRKAGKASGVARRRKTR